MCMNWIRSASNYKFIKHQEFKMPTDNESITLSNNYRVHRTVPKDATILFCITNYAQAVQQTGYHQYHVTRMARCYINPTTEAYVYDVHTDIYTHRSKIQPMYCKIPAQPHPFGHHTKQTNTTYGEFWSDGLPASSSTRQKEQASRLSNQCSSYAVHQFQ